MNGDTCYLGCPVRVVENLKLMNDRLNAEVVEQVNDTQELVLLNNFAKETNEYQFKKCLEERMADISSWQWVLDDLNKRLGDAIGTLQYEQNAIKVVIDRIRNELRDHCEEATRPGALTPLCDGVEDAIVQECDFLRDEMNKFEDLLLVLESQIAELQKIRKKIDNDILDKQKALTIEEACAKITLKSLRPGSAKKITRKKESPVNCWEKRCTTLKKDGLRALNGAVVTRQQVRAARVHLSIAAQSYSMRVDSALRRRMHVNQVKLQDLYWERDEALRDYNAMGEELIATEQNILETMEQERVVTARLTDRSLRPNGELTRDEVDIKLKDELTRLKCFLRQLRNNHGRITTLQAHLTDCITRIDCCIEDIMIVIRVDEDRIRKRLGEEPSIPINNTVVNNPSSQRQDTLLREDNRNLAPDQQDPDTLEPIKEEEEYDINSYPIDD